MHNSPRVGRRIDIVVTTPKGEYWIDVASVHTTAASYLPSTRAWFQREAEAEVCAADTGTENVLATQNSPAVAATVKKICYIRADDELGQTAEG